MGVLRNMRKQLQIVTIAVVAVLVCVSLFAFFALNKQPIKDSIEKEEPVAIDQNISPYTNQGIMIEVLRIRNRGLLDKMMQVGRSWRDPPSFYWKIFVDGKECDPQGNLGYTGIYTMWDTFGKESFVSYHVEEEQKTSEVTIQIIEQTKTGLFGLRSEDVEKQSIQLIYDYRTGRWTGDDGLGDDDGLGHVIGEEYEVWFSIHQSDYDHDKIPYWTEVNMLGTDPTIDDSNNDPDGDGIPTDWEWKWGYDPFIYEDHSHLDPDIDGIENCEEYQMRTYFSNPFQPDIYIETDGMEKRGLIDFPHVFLEESQQMVIERLAQHGYWVYIDDGWPDGPVNGGGEMVPFHQNFDDYEGQQILEFYKHHFSDQRKGIFRYVLFGNLHGGFVAPYQFNNMDTIHIGTGIKHTLFKKTSFTPQRFRYTAAAAALHELGHTFGLVPAIYYGNDIQPRSWGDNRYPDMPDSEFDQYLEKYQSVMNYLYVYSRNFFDFSDGSNEYPYDMDDWACLYLPSFQLDGASYEEPSDDSFQDFEVSDEYPGVILHGWEYNQNLTQQYKIQLRNFAIVKNADVELSVYTTINESNEQSYDVKVYARPKVEPVRTVWSLVAEGKMRDDGQIFFYDLQSEIDEVMSKL